MRVVKVVTPFLPQVVEGKFYNVEDINEHGMVFLMGITHPVPLNAVEFVSSYPSDSQKFTAKQYTLTEQDITFEVVPGNSTPRIIDQSTPVILEQYIKQSTQLI